MEKYKEVLLINGFMLILIFGSFHIVLYLEKYLVRNNYAFIISHLTKSRKTFAKLERIQNKSFFGYEHYFFTVSFWFRGKKYSTLKKVSSTLYYQYKEGNQIEAILLKDSFGNPRIFLLPQIWEEISMDKVKYKNLLEMSRIMFEIGVILLFFYLIVVYQNKTIK